MRRVCARIMTLDIGLRTVHQWMSGTVTIYQRIDDAVGGAIGTIVGAYDAVDDALFLEFR